MTASTSVTEGLMHHQAMVLRTNSLTFGVILVAALLLDIRYNPGDPDALSFTVAELLAWGFLLFAFATTRLDQIYKRYLKPAFEANFAALLWTGWAISAALASAFLLSRWEALQLAKDMVPGLIAFLFLSTGIRRRTDWERVEQWLLIGLLGLGLLGTSQFILGGPFPVTTAEATYLKLDLDGNFVGKVALGLSQHPNNFGALLAPPLAFATVLLARNPLRFRPLLMAAVIFGFVALYGTAMKGAFFWLFFALLLSNLPRRLLTSGGFILATGLIAYWLIRYAIESPTGLAGTILTRLMFWETALDNLTSVNSWLIGADIQQVAYDNLGKLALDFPHSHMAYLNNALYFGWPAAVLFFFALYYGVRASVRAAKNARNVEESAAARATVAALLTIAGIGVFEGIVEPNRFGIIYVFLALAGRQDKLACGAPQRTPVSIRSAQLRAAT